MATVTADTGMAMARRKASSLRPLFVSLLALTSAAQAAEWQFVPSINASETYSDNVLLAPSNLATPGFITNLMPGILITGTGDRLNFQLSYALQDMIYDVGGWAHAYYNQLNASGHAELLPRFLFLDGGASISQQPLTLLGPVTANAANLTGNVANVSTETISPYLLHDFGSLATGQVKFTRSATNYSYAGEPVANVAGAYNPGLAASTLFSTTMDTTDVKLRNGDAFDYLSWALDYNRTTTDYSNFIPATLTMSTLDLGYLLTPQFKLTGEGGYEDDTYVYVGPRPTGAFWNGGFSWAPTPRTQISATEGERFFGRTYSLNLSHYTRMTAWSASYSDQVTTSVMQQNIPPSATLDQLLAGQIPDPTARQQAVQQILASLGPMGALFGQNVLTNQVFLMKSLQATAGINTPRDVILLTVFSNQSTPLQQVPANATLEANYLFFGDFNQYGTTLSWSHHFTALLSANASMNVTRFSFPGQSLEENTDMFLFGFSETLSPKLSGILNFRHQLMNSGVGGYNFQENAIILGFTYKL